MFPENDPVVCVTFAENDAPAKLELPLTVNALSTPTLVKLLNTTLLANVVPVILPAVITAPPPPVLSVVQPKFPAPSSTSTCPTAPCASGNL